MESSATNRKSLFAAPGKEQIVMRIGAAVSIAPGINRK
jgi:hypothetical protein